MRFGGVQALLVGDRELASFASQLFVRLSQHNAQEWMAMEAGTTGSSKTGDGPDSFDAHDCNDSLTLSVRPSCKVHVVGIMRCPPPYQTSLDTRRRDHQPETSSLRAAGLQCRRRLPRANVYEILKFFVEISWCASNLHTGALLIFNMLLRQSHMTHSEHLSICPTARCYPAHCQSRRS